MKLYNTVKERITMAMLRIFFPESKWIIINPSTLKFPPHTDPMEDYLRMVKISNLLIIQEFNGYLGKGVFLEYSIAEKEKIPTLLIREINSKFQLLKIRKTKIIDSSDLKYRFAQITKVSPI